MNDIDDMNDADERDKPRFWRIKDIFHEYNMPSLSATERLFRNEPGVIRLKVPGGKRIYLRVPTEVVERVMHRMTVPPRPGRV